MTSRTRTLARWLGRAAAALLALSLVAAALILTRTPKLNRDWVEHLAVPSEVALRADGFSARSVIDWSYDATGPVRRGYTSFTAPYADLRNVWFVVEPQPGGGYAAHTLVLFEFKGDRLIGLTVEARRETDETYDPLRGVFNAYELAFVWSTAKDLLTRRAVYLNKEISIYPLALSAEQESIFLRSVLRETAEVEAQPRFYNTLVSNCTNELAKAAGLGWHYAWILTGYSPHRLHALGLIPGGDLATVQTRARIEDSLRAWNALPTDAYDRALLTELRARHAAD